MQKVVYVEDKILNKVRSLLKKDVTVLSTELLQDNYKSIAIVSQTYHFDWQYVQVIIYEEMEEELLQYVYDRYALDYDYYYLKNTLERAVKEKPETIIVGNSYACFGLEQQAMHKCINFALPSQDYYYAFRIIERICEAVDSVKNVIIGGGYYSIYSDISRTKNRKEMNRVANLYASIFHDVHNCFLLTETGVVSMKSDMLDIEKITDALIKDFYEKNGGNYFVPERSRISMHYEAWDDLDKTWSDLTESEKKTAGQHRAEMHNKNLKRKSSHQENIQILNAIGKYLSGKNINMIMTIFPGTAYYTQYLSDEFQENFYHTLGEIEDVDIHVIDGFDLDIFDDADFIDTDHLGDVGAAKMTEIVNGVLESL